MDVKYKFNLVKRKKISNLQKFSKKNNFIRDCFYKFILYKILTN